jgi:DNA polymerase II small subunit/DNA polymerase delta subunit B
LNLFYQNQEKIEEFFEKVKKLKSPPHFLTAALLDKILKREDLLIKRCERVRAKISVSFLTERLNRRYQMIRELLLKRYDFKNLLSINKISRKSTKFSLIVMVKGRENSLLMVEDPTAEIKLTIEQGKFGEVVRDETIALKCERGEEEFRIKEVIWPDIPLNRRINKTERDIYCLFLLGLKIKEARVEKISKWLELEPLYIFLSDREGVKILPKAAHKIVLDGSALIKIKNISLIFLESALLKKYSRLWPDLPEERIILNLLKKRHLDPILDIDGIYQNDPLFLEEVPDIIFTEGRHPSTLNYRGTTIICNGKDVKKSICYLINLKTREIIKKELA